MKVCVLQSSYDDSDSPLTEVDDFDCTPAHFFNDPDFMFTSVKLSKANAYTEIRKLAHSKQFDVFLNLCDGSKEEGRAGIEVVLALEELELPFTGSPAAFYEPTKIDMKKMAYDQGISFPNYVLKKSLHELDAVEHELKFPVIVKHPMGYSSIGMLKDAKCFSVSELKRASQFFIENFGSVLIEEFIAGREVTVLAFEDGQSNDVHAFEPVQIRFPSGEDFKHFDLKWKDFSDMTWTTMNSSDQVLAERCMEVGKKAFKSMLGGIGYGRSDLRIADDGTVYFLEINSNCGIFYPKGHFGSADYIIHGQKNRFEYFSKTILQAAIKRHQERQSKKPCWEIVFAPKKGFYARASKTVEKGETIFSHEGSSFNLVSRKYVEQHWNEKDKKNFAHYAFPISKEIFSTWSEHPSQWKPINHSCDPNLWFGENHSLNVEARRKIMAGEELTMDYSTFIAGDYTARFECRCEASNCRKIISGDDYQNSSALQELFGTRVSDFIFANFRS